MGTAWKWLVFLMALAAVSRLLTWKNGPGLIDSISKTIGNLFQGTING